MSHPHTCYTMTYRSIFSNETYASKSKHTLYKQLNKLIINDLHITDEEEIAQKFEDINFDTDDEAMSKLELCLTEHYETITKLHIVYSFTPLIWLEEQET